MNNKTGLCNFCGTGCGHVLAVDDGVIQGVFARAGHPVSRGKLCVRGWHIHELLRTPERITRPAVRGDGGAFNPVSHEEALSLAAGRLARYRGSEIAFWASPRASNEDNYVLAKLARTVFQSNNISLTSESGHGNAVGVFMEGTGRPFLPAHIPDIRKSGVLLVVGGDVAKQNPIVASELHFGARQGADLITISSRSTQIAKLSRTHIQPAPGSEKIVLACLAKAIIEEGLADGAFIGGRTEGYERFRAFLESLSWAAAETLTGVPPDHIRDAARRLAKAGRAMGFFSSGISGLKRDTIAALYNLFLAAGKLGKSGSGILALTGICNIAGSYDMGAVPDYLPGYRSPWGPGSAGLKALWAADIPAEKGRTVREILAAREGGLKALVIVDHDEEIVRHPEVIKELDFVLYAGAYTNKVSGMAHVVLPLATYAESEGTFTNMEHRVQLSRKKTEPPADVRPGWKLFSDLAEKLGRSWRYASASDVRREIEGAVPDYAGIDDEKLGAESGGVVLDGRPAGREDSGSSQAQGPETFKFLELADGLETPRALPEFPFLLLRGKANYFWHLNNIMKKTFIPKREYNALLLLYPGGLAEISPADAAKLGVRDKSSIRIVSAKGEMRAAARISPDIRPGSVHIPYFIQESVECFLNVHEDAVESGEDAAIPVRLEKV